MLEAKPDRAEFAGSHSILLRPLNCTHVTMHSGLPLPQMEYELMKVALCCKEVLFVTAAQVYHGHHTTDLAEELLYQ